MKNDDGGFFGKIMDKVFGASVGKKDSKAGQKKSNERGRKEAKREESERRENKRNVRLEMMKIADRGDKDYKGRAAEQDRKNESSREQDQNELER